MNSNHENIFRDALKHAACIYTVYQYLCKVYYLYCIRLLILEWPEMCLKITTSHQELRYLYIRWTAPEVSYIIMCPLHIGTCKRYRHCTFASILSKVMFGVTDVYCMRYGVLDIDHLEI